MVNEKALEKLLKETDLSGRVIERGMQLDIREHKRDRDSSAMESRVRQNQSSTNYYDALST